MATAAPKPEAAIARRDLLTLVGTAAAGFAAAGSAFAQSPAPDQRNGVGSASSEEHRYARPAANNAYAIRPHSDRRSQMKAFDHAQQVNSSAVDHGFHQSWFPVALAREVGSGAVLGVDFLGTRMVVYRAATGKPVVQSAWCPHLGADLSIGELVNNQIRCAYHHWRFDAAPALTFRRATRFLQAPGFSPIPPPRPGGSSGHSMARRRCSMGRASQGSKSTSSLSNRICAASARFHIGFPPVMASTFSIFAHCTTCKPAHPTRSRCSTTRSSIASRPRAICNTG